MFAYQYYAVDTDEQGEHIDGNFYAFPTQAARDRFIADADKDMEYRDVADIEEIDSTLKRTFGRLTWSLAPYNGFIFKIEAATLNKEGQDFLIDNWRFTRDIMNADLGR